MANFISSLSLRGDSGNPRRPVDYRVPGREAPEEIKLGWAREVIQSGEQYLKQQRSYSSIQQGRDALMGYLQEQMPKSLSKVKANRTKRQVREIVSTLSNLRARFTYKTDNKLWYANAELLNKISMSWWATTFADRDVKRALQYAAGEGMGWGALSWDRDYWTHGRGEIRMHTYGAEDVLPFHIGKDHDIQRAYAAVMRNRVPLAHAHAMFPKLADRIVPDSDGSSSVATTRAKMLKFSAPVLQRFGLGSRPEGDGTAPVTWPEVTLNYIYIIDPEVNDSGRPLLMGKAGTSWSYTVPYVGEEIFAGYDAVGKERTRKATEDDARIFPMRRLMVVTDTAVLYDGTSTFWHGEFPGFNFQLDKWPWDFLPFSLVNEVGSIDQSNNRLMRAVDDATRARLRPPLSYDDKIVAKSTMRRFDPRQESQRIGIDKTMGPGIEPVLPPQFYDVPQWIIQHIEQMEQRSDHLIGVQDFGALARARQIPAGDSMEALLQAIGPLVHDQTRELEQTITRLGEHWKGMALQYYNRPRLIQAVGPDQEPLQDMDLDPTMLIPSHMEYERRDDEDGVPAPSKFSVAERGRKHVNQFFMVVSPNSLHQINQMSRKLTTLQLWRSGFPIDPWTVAEEMDIVNFGPAPNGANNIYERWEAWQKIKTSQAMEAAKMMQRLQVELQMMGMGGQVGIPGDAGMGSGVPGAPLTPQGSGSGQPGQGGPGRPPTAQKPPSIGSKGDGRPVIQES